ncbi:MAG TPA: hypothetical protein VEI52_02615 [Terriglobales bacterium]|nr:hypothetical protein [Terriglobales bacterium]
MMLQLVPAATAPAQDGLTGLEKSDAFVPPIVKLTIGIGKFVEASAGIPISVL